MYSDTIVNEIHQFRAQLLDKHQGDFSAYFAALLQKQREHPERYATFTKSAVPAHQTSPLKPPQSKS
jgi:hypothetical protein